MNAAGASRLRGREENFTVAALRKDIGLLGPNRLADRLQQLVDQGNITYDLDVSGAALPAA